MQPLFLVCLQHTDYCKKLDCLVHVRDLLEGMFVYFLEVQSDRLFEEEPENCNSLVR